MPTCQGWQGSSLSPHISVRTTLQGRTFGLLASLKRIVTKRLVEEGPEKRRLAW